MQTLLIIAQHKCASNIWYILGIAYNTKKGICSMLNGNSNLITQTVSFNAQKGGITEF